MERNVYIPLITDTLQALAQTPSPTGMTHLAEVPSGSLEWHGQSC